MHWNMIFQKRTTSKLWLCLPALLALQAVAANEDVVVNLVLSPTVDMIDASWKLENSTGDVSEYRVSWEATEGSISNCSVNNSSSNTSGCDLRPSLSSCTSYTVTVQPQMYDAENFADTGTPASASNNTLPVVPPAVTDVQVIDAQSRSVSLEWARPETPCSITEYIISYEEDILWCCESDSDDSVSVTEFNDAEPTVKTVLQDLTPYSSYSITVAAVTEAGKGKDSSPVNSQTDEDVPGAPYSVETSALNSSAVKVSWEIPEEKNGLITHYTLQWKLDNTSTVYSESVPDGVLTYNVADLEECQLYQFSVTASTSAGEGEEAVKKDSPMASVTLAPEVMCEDKNWTTLVVWSTPTASCPIDGYEIHYTYNVLWSDDAGSEWDTVSASKNQFELEHTIPYSEYTYAVSAIVAGEVNGPQDTCTVQTNEAAPSAPQNLTLVKAADDFLTITWELPAELNGHVWYYLITWESEHSSHEHSLTSNNGQSFFMYTIEYLDPGTGYIVEVKAETVALGDPATGTFFTTGVPSTSTTRMPSASSSSSSYVGLIVICVFVATVLVAALIAVTVKRKDIRDLLRERSRPTHHRSNHPGSSGDRETHSASQDRTLNTIRRFEAEPQSLRQAFDDLKARSRNGPTSVGQVPQNVPKNRDMNSLPFDDTRVHLGGDAGISSDYINASHVKDASGHLKLIASQSPTDETQADFWQMVWQENVRVIVTLTSSEENEQTKCSQYWPDSPTSPLYVGSFSVFLRSAAVECGLCRRDLMLQNNRDLPRDVKQFHMTDWPELGVPATPAATLHLLDRVRAEDTLEGTTLVHCRAGDGRTGTVIALWNLQQEAQRGDILDVDQTILKMREDRQGLVQTESQYLYIYTCIATYLTAMQCSAAAPSLSQPTPATAPQMHQQPHSPPPPQNNTGAPPVYGPPGSIPSA